MKKELNFVFDITVPPYSLCTFLMRKTNQRLKSVFSFRGLAADYPIIEDYYLYPDVVGPSLRFPSSG